MSPGLPGYDEWLSREPEYTPLGGEEPGDGATEQGARTYTWDEISGQGIEGVRFVPVTDGLAELLTSHIRASAIAEWDVGEGPCVEIHLDDAEAAIRKALGLPRKTS